MNNDADYNYCAMPLAVYGVRPDQSRGRQFEEADSRYRNEFQRDRDRIIHCGAFRRLKYKTQVFVYDEGDHYRTRLTHTLEVAQIARSLARSLMVNEDLAETIALAHDLGHPPFAHLGEESLQACMEDRGGFDHNDQSLRLLVALENKYPGWRGLNLTWETLEGIVKHNGPIKGRKQHMLAQFTKDYDLEVNTHASLEAQIAALSDDIAYNNHDVEDGVRAGMFTLNDLAEISPMINDIIADTHKRHPDLKDDMLLYAIVREMIGIMVNDVLKNTRSELEKLKPQSANDIRNAGRQLVNFSPDMKKEVDILRKFLMDNMYQHFTIRRTRFKVMRLVRDLFEAFCENYRLLPESWQVAVREAGGERDIRARARVISDYISGMTDRYARVEHQRLFDLYREG